MLPRSSGMSAFIWLKKTWVGCPLNNNWLDPAIVVVCLLIAQLVQLVFGQGLSFADQDLALFAFIVSGPLLHRSDQNLLRPGQTAACGVLARARALGGNRRSTTSAHLRVRSARGP